MEKFKSKEATLDERVRGSSDVQVDKTTDMQWEKDTVQKKEPDFNFKLAPKNLSERKEESPKAELGPVAMSFDPNEGWVARNSAQIASTGNGL